MHKYPKRWKSWRGRPNYREKMFNRNVLKSMNNLFSSGCHGNYPIKCLKKNQFWKQSTTVCLLQSAPLISSNQVYFGSSVSFCKLEELFFPLKITIEHCSKGTWKKAYCSISPHANHGEIGKKNCRRLNLHFCLWNTRNSCLLLLSQTLFGFTFWWYIY